MLDKHVCFTTFVFKLFIINTIMFRLAGAVLAELKLVLSAVKDMKKAAEEEAKAAKLLNAATAKAQAAILAKFVEGSSEFARSGSALVETCTAAAEKCNAATEASAKAFADVQRMTQSHMLTNYGGSGGVGGWGGPLFQQPMVYHGDSRQHWQGGGALHYGPSTTSPRGHRAEKRKESAQHRRESRHRAGSALRA